MFWQLHMAAGEETNSRDYSQETAREDCLNLIKGPFYEPTWVHHYQCTINCMHLCLLQDFFVCLFCFWYTVRSPFGSINCDSLFTGIWASESSVVRSAQREEGLLQPEAAQQNWWAPSSSPSSLGKQHGRTARQNKTETQKGRETRKRRHETYQKHRRQKSRQAETMLRHKEHLFLFQIAVHRALSDADVAAV